MGLNIWQLALVVIIIALLFGRGRIPGLMTDIAAGIKGFKQGIREDDTNTATNAAPTAPITPTNSTVLSAASTENSPCFASAPLAVPAAPVSPCVPTISDGSVDSHGGAASARMAATLNTSGPCSASKSDA